jgi:hypothetical protein
MIPPTPTSPSADKFLSNALRRIKRFLLALSVAGLLVCVIRFRWPVTVGYLLGTGISYINQRWLERVVEALGERITTGQSRERGGAIVLRGVARYVFIAVGAYVIFNVSLAGLYGFLGGICLPIAAIACEVAVEIFVMLRHEF